MIEVDASKVAEMLGLETERFRHLMNDGRIKLLCERGTGSDTGLFRFRFFFRSRRAYLITDAGGSIIEASSADADGRAHD